MKTWTKRNSYPVGSEIHTDILEDNTRILTVTHRADQPTRGGKALQLAACAPELFSCLDWIVEFCAEHPEWTAENFPENSPENEWLSASIEAISKATA